MVTMMEKESLPKERTKYYNSVINAKNVLRTYASAYESVRKILLSKIMITQLVAYLVIFISKKIIS